MTESAERRTAARAGAQAEPDRVPVRILLVTGISGAGKSTALKAAEDIGYEAVDNLPLSLLSNLVTPSGESRRPLAIGVDVRTRDFGAAPFLHVIDRLICDPAIELRLLFLDCEDEVLRRRYTETRRRHPLALDRPVLDGIEHERRLVSPLRERADAVIDTSKLSLNDLRRIVQERFATDVDAAFPVFVISFSYRSGLPREADLVFDVRFLANPHYNPALRPLDGLHLQIGKFVAADEGFGPFFDALTGLLAALMPRYRGEGKSYLTLAVGCTGGRHRSVYVAERLAAWLRENHEHVTVIHRDLQGDAAEV